MKTCSRCGDTKPTTAFSKDASRKDGLRSNCRDCCAIYRVAWRKANPDKARALFNQWALSNPEKNKERKARWRAENPGKVKAIYAKWAATNPEKARASANRWKSANRDKVNASAAIRYAAKPERQRASTTKWAAENKEATRIIKQNRRASERASGGRLSKGLAGKLYKLQRGKCACCGGSLGDGYHLDHRMPLALDGPNTDDNIQLLCAACNLSKGAKHPVDFMQQRGYLI